MTQNGITLSLTPTATMLDLGAVLLAAESSGQLSAEAWPALRSFVLMLADAQAGGNLKLVSAQIEAAIGPPRTLMVRVLRDGVAVAVRVAEADWQRSVVIDSDPVGLPPTLAIQGWGIVDDAVCITLDDSDNSDMLTAERAARDAAALLALLEGEAVIKLLPIMRWCAADAEAGHPT